MEQMFPGMAKGIRAALGQSRSREGMNAKTDQSQHWITPGWLKDAVENLGGGRIDLDPCAGPQGSGNPVNARYWYTEADDGLVKPWAIEGVRLVYVNPPYKEARAWKDKALWESGLNHKLLIYFLGPAFTDQTWYHESLMHCGEEWSFKGRVRFLRPDGRPATGPRFPSALFAFGDSLWQGGEDISHARGRGGRIVLRGIIEKPLDHRTGSP
jgi:hypothetical protein